MGDLIGGIVSSIIGGGATGLLGAALQRFFDHKAKALDIEQLKIKQGHEIELRKVDAEIMREEWSQRVEVARIEGDSRESVADSQAFSASFQMEPQRYSDGVKPSRFQGGMLITLDFIRAIVRPVLTLYLTVIATLIYLDAKALMSNEGITLGATEAYDLVKNVTSTLLYLCTSVVMWYFGVRPRQQPPRFK